MVSDNIIPQPISGMFKIKESFTCSYIQLYTERMDEKNNMFLRWDAIILLNWKALCISIFYFCGGFERVFLCWNIEKDSTLSPTRGKENIEYSFSLTCIILLFTSHISYYKIDYYHKLQINSIPRDKAIP